MSIEELVVEIQSGNIGLKNELWERIKKLVYKLINRYAGYALQHLSEPDELINIAWFGVERAISDYKPERGYKFTAYLTYHIRNVIAEFFGFRGAKKINTISLDTPLDDDTDMTICDTIEDENAQQGFESVERQMIGEFVNRQVDKLSPQLKHIICEVFYENKTQKEIAERLGVTPSYVASLQNKALRTLRMRRELREYYKEFSFKHRGYKTFNTTWTSSTEWAVLKMEQLRNKLIEK